MRLIDADAFENYVFNEWQINEISNGDWIQFREWLKNQNTIVEFDGEINKVIVRGEEYQKLERKTGRWEITDAYPHNVYCSECHKKFAQTHWAVWENGSLPRNYCPNCGADMRGDTE